MTELATTASDIADIRQLHQAGRLAEAAAACQELVDAQATPEPHFLALHAALLLQTGQQAEGRQVLAQIHAKEPDNTAWASDLGMAHLLASEPERALALLERAVSLGEPDAAAYTRLGAVHVTLNQLEPAAEAFQEALLREPGRAEMHSNMGSVMLRLDRYDEALIHYDRALSLEPGLRQAEDGRNLVLVALDRTGEAVQRLEAELARDPDSTELRRRLSKVLLLDERIQEAENRLREAIDLEPEHVGTRLALAALLSGEDRHPAALAVLQEAAEAEPDNPAVLGRLARAYSELRRREDAEEAIAQAFELAPDAPGCYRARAAVRAADGDYVSAEADLRRALALHPGSAEAWGALGHNLMWIGQLDEAVTCFQRAAELNPTALGSLVEARAFPDDPAAVERLRRLADHRLMPRRARAAMSFALVRVCDQRGDYDQAFHYADQGNALQRRGIKYRADAHSAYVDRIIGTFTPELFAKHAGLGSTSERPVFVVGMPRSGTTLTEQVLASHPDVYGAGELGTMTAIVQLMPRVLKTRHAYPRCMAGFKARTASHAAAYYLDAIAKLDNRAARVVDKLPHNFLHLGLIALIFPRARIIHISRDDRDVAVSNYFTNFKHRRGGMAYAFDLADIGGMLKDHQRIMSHWRQVLPVPLFELRYEDLVANQEQTTRRLLDFLGLPWHEDVMSFHKTERAVRTASVWQVRQPLYDQSLERWRRYASHLGPLEQVLDSDNVPPAG